MHSCVCVACLSGEVLARIPVEMTYSLPAQDDSLAVRGCTRRSAEHTVMVVFPFSTGAHSGWWAAIDCNTAGYLQLLTV